MLGLYETCYLGKFLTLLTVVVMQNNGGRRTLGRGLSEMTQKWRYIQPTL